VRKKKKKNILIFIYFKKEEKKKKKKKLATHALEQEGKGESRRKDAFLNSCAFCSLGILLNIAIGKKEATCNASQRSFSRGQ